MRIWMSGEIDAAVGDDFSRIRNEIESQLKILERKSYGSALTGISIIPVIIGESLLSEGFFKERRLFQRKEKDCDYRLRISLDKFRQADEDTKRLLITKNLIVTIRDLGRKAGKDFDAVSLERDVLDILGVKKETIDSIDMYTSQSLPIAKVDNAVIYKKEKKKKPLSEASESIIKAPEPEKERKNKPIRDIRFYDHGSEYKALPSLYYGIRIARLLRNYGFSVGEADHVYFHARPSLPKGIVKLSTDTYREKWFISLEWGYFSELLTWPLQKADEFIIDLVFNGLEMLAREPEMLQILPKARNEILTHGARTKIFYKRKESQKYIIEVSYMISPHNTNQSVGLVSFLDRKSGVQAEKEFIELQLWDDIYPLIDTIAVTDGVITFHPKKSFRSDLYNQRYVTPIEIKISDILNEQKAE